MNFDNYKTPDNNNYQAGSAGASCFQSFAFPLCYFQSFLLLTALVLVVWISIDIKYKITQKCRITRKLIIICLMLLESVCFFLFNFDRQLYPFYFAMLFLQDIALCFIIYYYLRKAFKLTNIQQYTRYLKIPLIILLLIFTTVFTIDLVKYSKSSDKNSRCKQNMFLSLRIFALVLSFAMLLLGVYLTIKLKLKIKRFCLQEQKYSSQLHMLNKFWFLMVIIVISHILSLWQNYFFDNKTTCFFFPSKPILDTTASFVSKLILFYLPVIFTTLNYKSTKFEQKTVKKSTSQQIMLANSGFYFMQSVEQQYK